MAVSETFTKVQNLVRYVQIVTGCLIAGLVVFGTFAFIKTLHKQPGDLIMAYIAVGNALFILILRAFLPDRIVKGQRRQMISLLDSMTANDESSQPSRSAKALMIVQLVGTITSGLSGMPFFFSNRQLKENALRKIAASQPASVESDSVTHHLVVFQQMVITKYIVSFALLEGAGFFLLFSYMNSARWWVLATAGLMVVVMLMTFPTGAKIESWLRNQVQQWEHEQL
jgi:hypothetical protein